MGPVCVFVDGLWKNGKVVKLRSNDVVYKLSGDPDSYIISKDETHLIIHSRDTVVSVGKGDHYTGNNPLVFDPKGCNLYGKRIVERKDRPGSFRDHVKYQTKKYHKVRDIQINLGRHVRFLIFSFVFFLFFILILLFCFLILFFCFLILF